MSLLPKPKRKEKHKPRCPPPVRPGNVIPPRRNNFLLVTHVKAPFSYTHVHSPSRRATRKKKREKPTQTTNCLLPVAKRQRKRCRAWWDVAGRMTGASSQTACDGARLGARGTCAGASRSARDNTSLAHRDAVKRAVEGTFE